MTGRIARWRAAREHGWAAAHLLEYLDGELPPRDRERLERHAGVCPECRQAIASLRRTMRELTRLRSRPRRDVAGGVIERLRREGAD